MICPKYTSFASTKDKQTAHDKKKNGEKNEEKKQAQQVHRVSQPARAIKHTVRGTVGTREHNVSARECKRACTNRDHCAMRNRVKRPPYLQGVQKILRPIAYSQGAKIIPRYPTDFPRTSHGLPTDFPRISHGLPTVFHGLPTVSHGLTTVGIPRCIRYLTEFQRYPTVSHRIATVSHTADISRPIYHGRHILYIKRTARVPPIKTLLIDKLY